VAEAAVVGTVDELQGEVAVAFVVLRPGAAAAEQELRRFCKDRLAPYKVPARVVAIDAIPRNESGKPLKAELADRARLERAGGEGR
jgi:acyl-coenzyme A synthetase/AMP-(fatty) acid ligase